MVCRHSFLRQTTRILQLSENSMKFHKTTEQPKTPGWPQGQPHSTIPQVHGQNWRNNPAGEVNAKLTTNMKGTKRIMDQETSCLNRL